MLLNSFGTMFEFIHEHRASHGHDTAWYRFTNGIVKAAIEDAKSAFESGQSIPLGELGDINLPYRSMGAIDSLDLFGLDELIIFAFYLRNRNTYRSSLDIGANLGLHSIILGKLGFSVSAFEPDPLHYSILKRNLELNGVSTRVIATQAAVSDSDGSLEFVRVLGNTTGSHLAGSKSNPYGALERFPVASVDIKRIISAGTLAKIDVEGHEAVLLRAVDWGDWAKLDAFVEIGTSANAVLVFEYFEKSPINIFSQKSGWRKVLSIDEMPSSYREGSIFITARTAMPW